MRTHSIDQAGIELVNVSARYGHGPLVMEDVSVRLPAVGLVRLTGANGGGKSTFVELCSGYLVPASGQVLVRGRRAASQDAHRERRVVRARPALFPGMSARDHLVVASRAAGADVRELLERADRLGLGAWLEHDSVALSSGNAAKLWWLMCTPGPFKVLLADEPFAALDDASSAVLEAELMAFSQQALVVLVTHTAPESFVAAEHLHLAHGTVVRTSDERVAP